MADCVLKEITLDGVKYVRADGIQVTPAGNRAVVVVDRGWVFAGDVTEENGRLKLSRAVWVFRWESIGFDGMIANPKSTKVQLRPIPNGVDIPLASEILRVPVEEKWGL